MNNKYLGNELEYFAKAINWKKYFSGFVKPFLGKKVLEVGAGIGSNIPYLNSDNIKIWQCIEPDTSFCQIIKNNYQSIYHNLSIKNQTIDSTYGLFDSILYLDVIEHLQDDQSELLDAAKLLSNNGCLIILVPAHQFLFNEFDSQVGHFRRYQKDSLKNILPKYLQLVSIKYLDSLGLLASISNKLLLKQNLPTKKQISLWDGYMVPISRIIDKLFNYKIGKSLLLISRKNNN